MEKCLHFRLPCPLAITEYREMNAECLKHDPIPVSSDRKGLASLKCPTAECGSSRVVANGSYETKNFGVVTRFKCRACGHMWKKRGKTS